MCAATRQNPHIRSVRRCRYIHPFHTTLHLIMPWEVRYSNSRSIPYFFNPDTGKSAWDPPKGLTEAQIRQLPGATQYLKPLGPGIDPNYIPNPGSDTGGISEQLGDVKLAPIQQPKRVRASHILAKSTKSRRPSSWRQVSISILSAKLYPLKGRWDMHVLLISSPKSLDLPMKPDKSSRVT